MQCDIIVDVISDERRHQACFENEVRHRTADSARTGVPPVLLRREGNRWWRSPGVRTVDCRSTDTGSIPVAIARGEGPGSFAIPSTNHTFYPFRSLLPSVSCNPQRRKRKSCGQNVRVMGKSRSWSIAPDCKSGSSGYGGSNPPFPISAGRPHHGPPTISA